MLATPVFMLFEKLSKFLDLRKHSQINQLNLVVRRVDTESLYLASFHPLTSTIDEYVEYWCFRLRAVLLDVGPHIDGKHRFLVIIVNAISAIE